MDITRPGTAAAKVPLPAAAGPTTTTPGPLAVVPSAAAAASRRLQLSVSGYVLPQLGKENGSEDAWFSVTPLGGTATNGVVSAGAQPAGTVSALGVADGVGGWAQANVDPGQYSREMMAAVARAVEGKTSVSGASGCYAKAATGTLLVPARLAALVLPTVLVCLHVACPQSAIMLLKVHCSPPHAPSHAAVPPAPLVPGRRPA